MLIASLSLRLPPLTRARWRALAAVFGDSPVEILRRGLECFASRLPPDDRDLLHRIERRHCDRENV
jgi:hypothetical protein